MRSLIAIGNKIRPLTSLSAARFAVSDKHNAKDHARINSMGS